MVTAREVSVTVTVVEPSVVASGLLNDDDVFLSGVISYKTSAFNIYKCECVS